jgi:uncharacterized protein
MVVKHSPPRRGSLVLGLALFGYLGIVAFGRIPDRFILWPQVQKEPNHGAEQLLVPMGKGVLEVWRARSSVVMHEPDVFVLRFYGNADRADRWVTEEAKAFPNACELWGVNYPGFGGSTGPASLKGVADSAITAYDALRTRAGSKPILVSGTSLGTTAALHVAANRPVAGLFLQNPPPLKQLIIGDHGWWNLWLLAIPVSWQIPDELDSIANAERIHAPAVFLLSGNDDVVGYRYQQMVFRAYAGNKTLIDRSSAGHNDAIDPETAARIHAAIRRMLACR